MSRPRFLCAISRHGRHVMHIDHGWTISIASVRVRLELPMFCLILLRSGETRLEPSSTRPTRHSQARTGTQTTATSAWKRHPRQHESRARSLTATLLLTNTTGPMPAIAQLHDQPLIQADHLERIAQSPLDHARAALPPSAAGGQSSTDRVVGKPLRRPSSRIRSLLEDVPALGLARCDSKHPLQRRGLAHWRSGHRALARSRSVREQPERLP